MTEEAMASVMCELEDGHFVVIWYKPQKDFSINCGEFSIDQVELPGEEVDYVVKNRPLVASVESEYEVGDREDEDPAEGTFTDVELGREIQYSSHEVGPYWSIEIRSDIEGYVSSADVADRTFTFNQLSHSANIDGDDISRAELEVLHEKVGTFLDQTS